jgi:cysteine desulfurase
MSKKKVVYLDSNSTTELSQEVSGTLMDIVIQSIYGNPSSAHIAGKKIRAVVEASRFSVADTLDCDPSEVIFTSGGTESNNLALRGVYHGGEIVTSAAEHSSVFNTVSSLNVDDGFRTIPLLPDGSLDLEWADKLINEDTTLVSVMLANNETGAIFPVKEIVRMAHERGALVHCDAVQAYGKMFFSVKDLGVDLLSISGHKTHALPGIGALYVRKGLKLHPMFTGGKQESTLRPGTENYVGIASLGVVAEEIGKDSYFPTSGLRDAFEKALLRKIPNIRINAYDVDRVYNTSNVIFEGIPASAMVKALEEQGVMVSSGSACSSGSDRPSRTLKAMGLSDEDCLSSVRFSFSQYSTISDVSEAINSCIECVHVLRESYP